MSDLRELSTAEARAIATVAQGLRNRAKGTPAELVRRHGFLRTLGGIDVYLALHERSAGGVAREEVDAAVAEGEVQIVPTVRGCIYLVAREDVPWSLRLADLLSARRNERDQEKAGVEEGELERVGEAVLATLREKGPLSTVKLRNALPDGVIRSLGDAGKKVGLSSTLPPALRRLELAGEIERTLETGQVDTEKYLWRVTAANPFAGVDGIDDPAVVHRHFAERFFRWAGVATLDAFAAWSGLGKRDSKKAMADLGLEEVTVEGFEEAGPWWLHPDAATAPAEGAGAVALLPFIDNLPHLQGGPGLFVDPAYHDTPVPVWGRGKGTTLGDARHMSYRSVVAGDKVVGFWEYDPDAEEVVVACVDQPPTNLRPEIDERAETLGRFIRDELGHGQSFSIDTDKDLRRRAGQIREMAKG